MPLGARYPTVELTARTAFPRRRVGAAAVDAVSAAGVRLPSVGQLRQPDRDLEGVGVGLQRGRCVVEGAGPLPGPPAWNEHMPSTPASTMQASTNGAIDQNMSRPSCSSRDLAGLGAGCGWVVMVASIPGPKRRAANGTICA